MADFPDCECGQNDWYHMPDSLAWACIGEKGCGRVIIKRGNGWVDGVGIREWLSDVYGKDQRKDDRSGS